MKDSIRNSISLGIQLASIFLLIQAIPAAAAASSPITSKGAIIRRQAYKRNIAQRPDLNELNQFEADLFGISRDSQGFNSKETIEDSMGGATLNLNGDEFYLYNPDQSYLPNHPSSMDPPGVLLSAAAKQDTRESSLPEASGAVERTSIENQPETLDKFQAVNGAQNNSSAQVEGAKLDQLYRGFSYGNHNNQKEFDSDIFCIGHQDFQKSFNWLCQGSKLKKAPVDLQPEPMSL